MSFGGRLAALLHAALGKVSVLGLVLAVALAFVFARPAAALNPIVVGADQDRIEITTLGELYEGRGDSLQIETAPGADGMTGRMSVAATTPGTNPNWVVFALTNPTDKPVERWVAADRYNVVGSGVVWPDLDARRIEGITPSIGFVPERIRNDRADLFRITLEPGQTITYVAELATERFARLYLWKPLEYELRTSDRQLFNGVMLGVTGLMAVFLTAIFAANHKLVFPASALVAWCALAYLCVDFGFFHKLFNMKPEANAVYRAASESALAASLVVFLHVFLRLALWHGLVRMLISVWLLAQFSLIAVAIIDPRLAATFARLSFLFVGATGAGLILFLAFRGQDRALTLVPTWILFLVWIFGAGVTLTGQLSGEVVVNGLVAGLVLILLLIGFTVTQFAFRSIEPLYGAAPSELQARSIAVDASGAATWEWNARRDEVKVANIVESWLGLAAGELSARTDDFAKHLHPSDRERFKLALFGLQERRDGRISCDFRIRQADNSYRWFEIEGAGVPGSDPRSFKCIGLMRDVTDQKRAHERLLHDAVHDSLTGLPNRKLILDRLEVAVARAKSEPHIRPTVLTINIDKFTSVNSSLGLVLGDSLLLTIARRLQRHLGPSDTLARLGGDQFAILMLADQPVQELASHAERIRRSLRSPIKIAGQEMVLTGSLGIAVYEGQDTSHEDLLKQSEIAMYRAKRAGADRIEVFSPEMRGDQEERRAAEAELRRAMDSGQLKLVYRPIVYLPTEELAGFEAQLRWEHPTLGVIDPLAYVQFDDESDIVVKLGAHVLARAARDAANWQKEHTRSDDPLFVLVKISSRHLFRQDAIQEIRHVLGRNLVPKGTLKLVISEQLLLENPEQATEVLEWLRGAGAEIALDEFGTGYSSLPYLERLPFDTIMVDNALVQAAGADGNGDSKLLRSVVALGRELDKSVIACGAETKEDASLLRGIGCEFALGTYCGTPIAEADVGNVLSYVRKSESKLKPRALFRTKPQRKSQAATVPRPDRVQSAAARTSASPNGAAPAPAAATGQMSQTRPAVGGETPPAGAQGRTGGGARRRMPAAPPPNTGPQPSVAPPFIQPAPQERVRAMPAGGNGAMPPPMPPAGPSMPVSPAQSAISASAAMARLAEVLPTVPESGVSAAFTQAPPKMEPMSASASLQTLAAQLEKSAPTIQEPMALPPSVPQNAVPPSVPPPLMSMAPPARSNAAGSLQQQPQQAKPQPFSPPPLQQAVQGAGPAIQPPPGSSQAPPPGGQGQRPTPDFSNLPPSIAESLARLAGGSKPRKTESSGA